MVTTHYGMKTESDGPEAMLDFSEMKGYHYLSQEIIQRCKQVNYGRTT